MSKYKRYGFFATIGLIVLSLLIYGLATTPTIDTDRTESVFVYGTLTNPIIRMFTCQCRTAARPATVRNYKKVGRNILTAPNDRVDGQVIQVTKEELANLDAYENVPHKYVRTRITTTDGGEHWVYVLRE